MRDVLNPLDYADDPEELHVQKELRRLDVENEATPDSCTVCKGELVDAPGMVGETILYCPEHGIMWEDGEDAIRRVI